MAGIVLSDENFAALELAIDEALEAETPQSYTAAEVVSKYQKQLRKIIKKYNHEKALEILKSQGIEITKFTLIQYLSNLNKKKKKTTKVNGTPSKKENNGVSNTPSNEISEKNKPSSNLENDNSKPTSKLSGNPIDTQNDLASEFNLDI